ncbi:hypothetical protein ABIC61_002761 [Curtobacterium sp. 1544]
MVRRVETAFAAASASLDAAYRWSTVWTSGVPTEPSTMGFQLASA